MYASTSPEPPNTSNAPSSPEGSRVDIDEIERLLRDATPGPWVACRFVHHERGDDMTPEEVGEYVRNSVIKSEGESGSSAFLAIRADKPDGPADVCHVGNGPTSPANAKLIETIVNAAPSILAELRALRAMVGEPDRNCPRCSEVVRLGYEPATKHLVDRVDVLEAQNERMRMALESIASHDFDEDCCGCEVARAALDGGKGE